MTETPRLRSVRDLIAPAVAETLSVLALSAEDVAAARLAQQYAAAIDAAGSAHVLERLGPKLMTCLVELGATPASRAKLSEPSGGASVGALAALRAARSS